jgi:hypothetical protein
LSATHQENDIIKTDSSETRPSTIKGRVVENDGLQVDVLYGFVEDEAHSGDYFHGMDLI